jgi:hypothetical protein
MNRLNIVKTANPPATATAHKGTRLLVSAIIFIFFNIVDLILIKEIA